MLGSPADQQPLPGDFFGLPTWPFYNRWIDLPKLSAEELDAALALAAAASVGATGGRVELIRSAVPPEMAEPAEQARALRQAALDLGRTRLGFQRSAASQRSLLPTWLVTHASYARTRRVSALSAATGLTRITVRQVLGDQVERGSVVRANGGHQITDCGVKRFRARFDEFFQKVREPLFRFHRILGREYPGEGV